MNKYRDKVLNGEIQNDEFSLSDIPGWHDGINQASYTDVGITTINTIRPTIGRIFYNHVKSNKSSGITIAEMIDSKGIKQNIVNKQGAMMYHIIKETPTEKGIQNQYT